MASRAAGSGAVAAEFMVGGGDDYVWKNGKRKREGRGRDIYTK
jgi:hypothetical protein